jgi:hypothetical protein
MAPSPTVGFRLDLQPSAFQGQKRLAPSLAAFADAVDQPSPSLLPHSSASMITSACAGPFELLAVVCCGQHEGPVWAVSDSARVSIQSEKLKKLQLII